MAEAVFEKIEAWYSCIFIYERCISIQPEAIGAKHYLPDTNLPIKPSNSLASSLFCSACCWI